MNRFFRFGFALVLGFALAGGACRCSAPRAAADRPAAPASKYQYELQAIVKVNGAIVRLPKPMYFTDCYMGAWSAFDLSQHPDLDLSTKLFYVPNQQPGPYYIGPYSSENFGDPATVRRKLRIIKDAGLYPAIHILSRHLIDRNFQRRDWNDYGAKVRGVQKYSYDLFRELYLPILEELKLPYIIAYDMWGFDYWAPGNVPNETFDRLYWEEFEENIGKISRGCAEDRPTDLHIRIREYTSDFSLKAYHPAIYLFGCSNSREKSLDASLRVQVLQAIGNPNATDRNPYTGKFGNYGGFFWIFWGLFSPDVRSCPAVGNHGLWNIVNTDQVHAGATLARDFAAATKVDAWMESLDNLGPRYFYGYIPHVHNAPRGGRPNDETHNSLTGSADETSFLTYKAVEKGMVFTGIWNEYSESIIMEPANNVGTPADEHTVWANGRPVFLDNFVARKIPVTQPPELRPSPTEKKADNSERRKLDRAVR